MGQPQGRGPEGPGVRVALLPWLLRPPPPSPAPASAAAAVMTLASRKGQRAQHPPDPEMSPHSGSPFQNPVTDTSFEIQMPPRGLAEPDIPSQTGGGGTAQGSPGQDSPRCAHSGQARGMACGVPVAMGDPGVGPQGCHPHAAGRGAAPGLPPPVGTAPHQPSSPLPGTPSLQSSEEPASPSLLEKTSNIGPDGYSFVAYVRTSENRKGGVFFLLFPG